MCELPTEARQTGRRWSYPAAGLAARSLIAAIVGLWLLVAPARAGQGLWIPGGMPTGHTVTAEQLWEQFDRTLPAGVWVSPLEATHYEVISAKWLRGTFLPALKKEMDALRTSGVPEENYAGNCSGFGILCRLMLGMAAMEAHARAPAAASVIVYQARPFGGLDATFENHSVAFVLTDEGPWIIEVQSGAHIRIEDYPNLATVKLVNVH